MISRIKIASKKIVAAVLSAADPKQHIAATQLSGIYFQELAQTTFVSSRGLLNISDLHNHYQVSDNPHIDANLLLNTKDGNVKSIYVNTHALESFIDNLLGEIHFPFVLVSGDSDLSVNSEYPSFERLMCLINHPKLRGWFAQNLCLQHDKLVHLPIGVDYHNIWEKPGKQEPLRWTPLSHDAELMKIIAASKPLQERIPLAYCNWHFMMHRGERADCYRETNSSLCYYEANKLPRFEAYRAQSNYCFVLSPQGKGMDCFRTWEALALGCIPILKKSALDPLFEDLPVLLLDSWKELTHDLMVETLHQFKDRRFHYQKLFLSYWQQKISCNDFITVPFDWFSMPEYLSRIHKSLL